MAQHQHCLQSYTHVLQFHASFIPLVFETYSTLERILMWHTEYYNLYLIKYNQIYIFSFVLIIKVSLLIVHLGLDYKSTFCFSFSYCLWVTRESWVLHKEVFLFLSFGRVICFQDSLCFSFFLFFSIVLLAKNQSTFFFFFEKKSINLFYLAFSVYLQYFQKKNKQISCFQMDTKVK